MDKYGDWLDEGMDRSASLGLWRLVYSVCGSIILVTAILCGLFVMFGWM